jgi:hypothetical protein
MNRPVLKGLYDDKDDEIDDKGLETAVKRRDPNFDQERPGQAEAIDAEKIKRSGEFVMIVQEDGYHASGDDEGMDDIIVEFFLNDGEQLLRYGEHHYSETIADLGYSLLFVH